MLDPWTPRAPDVSVGGVADEPGFARSAPPLAVDYVEADADERDLHCGESVDAAGVLRNAVPVDALYDRAAAHALMLRNLLDRAGYPELDAAQAAAIERCTDLATLDRWLDHAHTAPSAADVLRAR